MKWYLLDKNENLSLPEWARTFGLEDGVVFVPAALAQIPENKVCQYFDETADPDAPMAQYNEHFYMPSSWLSQEFPEIADVCRLFELQAQKTIAASIGFE